MTEQRRTAAASQEVTRLRERVHRLEQELAGRQRDEDRFRHLLDASAQGILVHRDFRPLYLNTAWARLFGYARPEEMYALGSVLELLAPHERERVEGYHRARVRGEEAPTRFDVEACRRDGSRFWLGNRVQTVDWGDAQAILITGQDITERKHERQQLRTIEARYNHLVEGSIQGIIIHRDFRILFANQAFAELLGYDSAEAVLGLNPVDDVVAPAFRERMSGYYQARVAGGSPPQHYRFQAVRRDGQVIWLDNISRPVDWEGRPAVQATIFDVTEQQRAAEEISASEARFRWVAENAPGIIYRLELHPDGRRRFTYLSQAVRRITGYAPEEIYRDPELVFGRFDEAQQARYEEELERTFRSEDPENGDFERIWHYRRRDGEVVQLSVQARRHHHPDGVIEASGLAMDVTEQQRAAAALRASEARLRWIAENSPGIIYRLVHHPDGRARFEYVSEAAERITGFSPKEIYRDPEVVFRRFPPHQLERYQQEMRRVMAERDAGDARVGSLWRFRHRQGHELWLRAHTHREFRADGAMESLGVVVDVTDLQRAEQALSESEQRFRDFTEVASDWVWETDAEHRFTFLSDRVYDALGVTPASRIGRTRWSAVDTGRDPELWARHQADLEARRPFRLLVYSLVDDTGRTRYVQINGKPLFDRANRFLGYRGTGRDITAEVETRRRAEEAHQRLIDAIESVPAAFYLFDREERLVLMNSRAPEQFPPFGDLYRPGRTFPEICEHIARHELVPDAVGRGEAWRQERLRRFRDPPPYVEVRLDEDRWVRVYDRKTGDGGTVSIRVDITDLKRREAALQASEARFRNLVEGSIQGILIHRAGHPLFVNQAFAEIFGYDTPEAIHALATTARLVHPEDYPRLLEFYHARMRGEPAPTRYEFRGLHRDGSVIWLECINTVVNWDGEPAVLSTYFDITEPKEREAALRQSEERFRNLVEGSIQGTVIHRGHRPLFVNDALVRLFGYESQAELTALNSLLDLAAPHERGRIAGIRDSRMSGEGAPEYYQFEGVRRDGSRIWLDCLSRMVNWDGEPAIQTVMYDISERVQLEEQLRQSQKMEAVGLLAGGVAHDFNNLLQIITGFTRLGQQDLADAERLQQDLEMIHDAAERAAALTRQLLAFSRQQVLHPVEHDPNDAVNNMARLVRRVLDPRIELAVHCHPEPGLIRVDPGMIEQVLLNLCVNARDAMPEGGRLTITTGPVALDEAFCRSRPDARPGPYVEIAVADTGAGIPEDSRSHLFEPFFTTKETGKGTGLGLSTAYGIVRQHRGLITVDSAPGRGSVFRVLLPRIADGAPAADQAAGAAPAPAGGETVLVAEDEAAVRELTVRALEGAGYRVIAAGDGAQALERHGQHAGEIALAVLDVVMPRLGGWEVYRELRRQGAELPVLFSSGYPPDIDLAGERAHLLRKPYRPEALLQAVRRALDEL